MHKVTLLLAAGAIGALAVSVASRAEAGALGGAEGIRIAIDDVSPVANVHWRRHGYGWRRHHYAGWRGYGWRRPYYAGWRGYGWRRPYYAGWGGGWGWGGPIYGAVGFGTDAGAYNDNHVLAGVGLEYGVTDTVSLRGQYLHGFPVTNANPIEQVTFGAEFHF